MLGLLAVRRGDVRSHRAWVVRAYAIGLGAGTQAFTEGFSETLLGEGVLAPADPLTASGQLHDRLRALSRGRRQVFASEAPAVCQTLLCEGPQNLSGFGLRTR